MSSEISIDEATELYWRKFFPYHDMWRWLSIGNNTTFSKREFNYTQSERYIRYKSYVSEEKWKFDVSNRHPDKMDIGAIYNIPPSDKDNYTTLIPAERELVFDVDMNDYDDLRTCCKGAKMCQKCWAFIATAIQVLDSVLRIEFGFSHFFFVYSGRRGLHCWVCDEGARKLSEEERTALLQFLTILPKSGVLRLGQTLHPTFERLYSEILLPSFEQHILPQQKLLDSPDAWNEVLKLIPNQEVAQEINAHWQITANSSRKQKWQDLKTTLANNTARLNYTNPIWDIVFHYTYPRLDVNVSKGLNHLLKAPFSPHAATHRICIPVYPDSCFQFNPDTVPTVLSLFESMGKSDLMQPILAEWDTRFLVPYEKSFQKNNSSRASPIKQTTVDVSDW